MGNIPLIAGTEHGGQIWARRLELVSPQEMERMTRSPVVGVPAYQCPNWEGPEIIVVYPWPADGVG